MVFQQKVVESMKPFFALPLRCAMLGLLLLFYSTPALASSSGKPAWSETLSAGPYTIVVGLSNDPPIVDQDFTVSVASHGAVPLSGMLAAQPGPGTDALPAHTTLTSTDGNTQELTGTLHLVVRGAWTIVMDLNGPRGQGSASFNVTVTAPNAMPAWIGWTIGLLPLIGCVWLIWQQWRYRNTLLRGEQKNRNEKETYGYSTDS